MKRTHESPATMVWQIKVLGELGEQWSNWFDGLAICVEQAGGSPVTRLTGPIADQAHLRGILNQLWDLNLTLISVASCKG